MTTANMPPAREQGEKSFMATIAFVGLGIMGGPMAANLVKAGYDVVGYNRSPAMPCSPARVRAC
jgi:3-hydroxyisobutyrate dehydrogenase-like beta-hydroxyacid dehydrogenase